MTWTTQPRSKFGQLNAIVSGIGQQIVFIHGVGLRAEAWSEQTSELSKLHKTVAIDIPGHGECSIPTDDFSLKDYAELISAAITTPSIIVGHSFGAMIALELAFRHSRKVKSVIALNAIFKRDEIAKKAVKNRFNTLSKQSNSDPSSTLNRWFSPEEKKARKVCKDWLSSTDPRGYYNAYKVFSSEDGPNENDLNKLHCPSLFITGSREPNSTPEMTKNMSKLTHTGKMEIFDDAAHMLPMTHAKHLNKTLKKFIMDNA